MPFAKTTTGEFLIGYRSGGGPWQKKTEEALAWTIANGFGTFDLPPGRMKEIPGMAAKGVKIGSLDLMEWGGYQGLISPDKAKRTAAVELARNNIENGTELGATIFFTLMLPEDPNLPREENFKYMVESYSALVATLEKCGGKLAVEGWPGPGALCCTPETYRALFEQIPSPVVGVNYDPSHLVRMGIDYLRFLHEFAGRVHHVHGKDTEIIDENLYEFGSEQPATFAKSIGYGAWSWRYTIPGHGIVRWTPVFKLLVDAGYRGFVSIELEDARFCTDETNEKLGLIKSREFLEGV
jgi:sugar phosphate isomerase/epimerase